MNCSEVERALPELLDGETNGAFPVEVENHVKSCTSCSSLISDLGMIAGQARQLAAGDEPSPRVWARIALQLRTEGIIHEGNAASEFAPTSWTSRPILLPTPPRRRWTSTTWWLAPVAAGLLAAGAYMVRHTPAAPVARLQAPVTTASSPAPALPLVAQSPASTPSLASDSAPQHPAQKPVRTSVPPAAVQPNVTAQAAAEPEPSADDRQFLSVVSTRAPSMRVTYENQLKAVNADILETQAYVNRNPKDADARQHLMDAYQQKALLYQIALDRIQ